MLFQTRSHHPSLHKSIEFKLSGYVQHIFDIQSFVFFSSKKGSFLQQEQAHNGTGQISHNLFTDKCMCCCKYLNVLFIYTHLFIKHNIWARTHIQHIWKAGFLSVWGSIVLTILTCSPMTRTGSLDVFGNWAYNPLETAADFVAGPSCSQRTQCCLQSMNWCHFLKRLLSKRANPLLNMMKLFSLSELEKRFQYFPFSLPKNEKTN